MPGCHCDCMTEKEWHDHTNTTTGQMALAGVGAVAIGFTLATGGLGAIGVAATPTLGTALVGGGSVASALGCMSLSECPHCGHSCDVHRKKSMHWQQKVERRQIIAEEAQLQAEAQGECAVAVLSQFERSADELEEEQKPVQKEVSRACADYGGVCTASGLPKTLLQQLQGIRERMEGTVNETEKVNLQAHQHEIQHHLEAVENNDFHSGHSAC